MRIIVLDYSDGTVNYVDTESSISTEEIESLLSQQFRLKDIYWMISDIDEVYYYREVGEKLIFEGSQ